MTKVLVIGANGMLGYAVSEYFRSRRYQVLKLTRKEFDIVKDPIEKIISWIKDSYFVVNCAGVIKPRIAEIPLEDVLKVNAIFPRNLATLCNRYGKFLFHITTDCAFSGKKGKYTETDLFDAEDIYGLSKNAGDISDCMVLRTSIIGEERENNRSLLSWVLSQRGKAVNGFTNHLWNGVTTLYLAEMIEKILGNYWYEKGIFHVFSKETVNKFELLTLLNEVYQLQLTINQYATEKPCDRSLSTVKSLNDKVVDKSLRTQIIEMKAFFRGLHSEKHGE